MDSCFYYSQDVKNKLKKKKKKSCDRGKKKLLMSKIKHESLNENTYNES